MKCMVTVLLGYITCMHVVAMLSQLASALAVTEKG